MIASPTNSEIERTIIFSQAAAFSFNGIVSVTTRLLRLDSVTRSIAGPESTGWSEQNPDDWWQMTVEAVQELMARTGVKGREVKAIGMSGQMHGTVLLGERARLLRPA